jgi:hypothetical protein
VQVLEIIKTVAWSFIGIRKHSESQAVDKLNPLHIIVLALVAVALFVGALVLLVHWVAG